MITPLRPERLAHPYARALEPLRSTAVWVLWSFPFSSDIE